MRYPFVLFDAGETLLGPRESFGATYARVLRGMGRDRPPDVFERALRATWAELNLEVPRGQDRYHFFEGGEDGYWLHFASRTIERASGPAPAAFSREALQRLREEFRAIEAWEVFSDVVPTLAALERAGVRMGIVSNWDSRLPDVLEMLGLARFFPVVTISCLEGIEKPDPELFRRALARLGAPADRTLHVGDVPELDLEGARAAGIDAVLVDRSGRLEPGRAVLSDFSPLPSIVARGIE